LSGLEEEMVVLARTGRVVREMVGLLAEAVVFFLVGLGVVGGALVGVGVAELVGADPLGLAGLGAGGGLVAGLTVFAWLARYLPVRRTSGGWKCAGLIVAVLVSGQFLVGLAGADVVRVAWFPVIGLVFIAASTLCGVDRWAAWAGLGVLAASPLVVWAGNWYLAVGIISLIFMIAGSWLTARALEKLEAPTS